MRILKEIAGWLFVLTGLTRIATRFNRRKPLVLLYHGVYSGVLDPVLNPAGLHVRVDRFERQMRYLRVHYCVVPLDQLLDGEARAGMGKPLAAVTFDDGYQNVYRYAYPVLKRLALPATVFVPTDFLQSGRAQWWDRISAMVASTRRPGIRVQMEGSERWFRLGTVARKRATLRALVRACRRLPPPRREALLAQLAEDVEVARTRRPFRPLQTRHLREMVSDGIAVGGHGCSHDSFLHLDRERLEWELTESKRVLESIVGHPVRWLAYPYGDFSRDAIEVAMEAGYRGAVTTIEGLNNSMRDPYVVRRIGVDDSITFPRFVVAVSGLRDTLKGVWGFLAAAAAGRVRATRARQIGYGYTADARDHGSA